ncbi:PepSY domain-containing protein [Fredinandcohnia sp. 179-A 10B2 NHS]|uniref:PepSY domain-containing protein n=1 Tax=Fredinandcohnia sp. 179-A 10B2 NHS TaxID=3235176 RepID=UPI0039A2B67A
MRKINLRTTIIAVLIVFVATFGVWQLTKTYPSAEPLSESDASKLVEGMYNGKIIGDITIEGEVYKVTFELETGVYEINVHRETGEVTNLTKIPQEELLKELSEENIREIIRSQQAGDIEKIERKEEEKQAYFYVQVQGNEGNVNYKLDAITGDIVEVIQQENIDQPNTPVNDPTNPPNETVRRITEQEAIQIALQQIRGKVDEVELEEKNGQPYYFVDIENEEKEEEGTVQIHAISGEVITIVWDD